MPTPNATRRRTKAERSIPAPTATPLPLAVPLPQAPALTGLSRSTIYRAAHEGRITLLKVGRSTLVDMESVRTFLASLPRAGGAQPSDAA